MAKRRTLDEDRALDERLHRFDLRYEEISRMLLGEPITGAPGLLQRQLTDEQGQKDIMKVLHDIKKDIRTINHEIKMIKDEFEWYKGVLRLPSKKKFWVGVLIVLALLVVLSRWTADAYTMIVNAIIKYYHQYAG